MTDREAELLVVNQAFYDAFEALDLARMAHVWSEAAPAVSCVHPAGELVVGRDAVLASWRRIFDGTSAIRFALRDVRAFVAGDTGWVVLEEQIESRHGGRRVAGRAQATNVFVREGGERGGEGERWRMVHHHAAPARAAEPPPSDRRTLN